MVERSLLIDVFRDKAKQELVTTIPYRDLGIVTSSGVAPTSDEGVIHVAKLQIHATTKEDADALFYDVRQVS